MFSRNARVSARTVSGESAAWKVSSEIQPAYPVAASARNAAAYSERARPGRSDQAGMMAIHLVQVHVPDDVGVDRNQPTPRIHASSWELWKSSMLATRGLPIAR